MAQMNKFFDHRRQVPCCIHALLSQYFEEDTKLNMALLVHRINASFGMSRNELQEKQSKVIYKVGILTPSYFQAIQEVLKEVDTE